MQLISTVVNRNWTDIARYGSLENWRELLAAMVTYAGPEDFAPLCGKHLFMDVFTLHMYVHVVCIYHCMCVGGRYKFMSSMMYVYYNT